MNDEKLKGKLRNALQSMQSGDVPEFDTVWANAGKRRTSRSRNLRLAGLAVAATVAAATFMLWPLNGNNSIGPYLTEEDLMSSTQWLAPSDGLFPKHHFDIYSEVPRLIETNDLDEGPLL